MTLPLPEPSRADPTMVELDLDDPRWLAFVTSSPVATAFHHPAWARVLRESYGFPAFALAMDVSGEITAGMPVMEVKRPLGVRRWVSLPFTDHCSPLVAEGLGDHFTGAATQMAERAGIRQLEVHAPLDGPGIHLRAEGVIHTLGLGPDPDQVRRSFHRSQVIRNIDRAERAPITLRRATSASDVTDAYYGLHVRTRRKQGVPVQPRRFFRMLWTHMLDPGLGFVLLVYSGSTPIAGAVFLAWNGTITYKYGASDPDYLHLRPNHLIFWDAIQWACENGFSAFSFGRSDMSNQGLRDFKSGWGAREEDLYYSGIGGDPLGLPMERMVETVARVIRRSPLWVTRALGEVLYPFVA